MNVQNVIVAIIIFAALFYVGLMFWNKAKSVKTKDSSCAADCGCDSKVTGKKV